MSKKTMCMLKKNILLLKKMVTIILPDNAGFKIGYLST